MANPLIPDDPLLNTRQKSAIFFVLLLSLTIGAIGGGEIGLRSFIFLLGPLVAILCPGIVEEFAPRDLTERVGWVVLIALGLMLVVTAVA